MNVLRIAIKELKSIRDVKMLIFMIATPVLLMLILGTALTNAFNGSISVGDIRVLYKLNSSENVIAQYWDEFTGQADQSSIHFERVSEDVDGKLAVKNNLYAGYVEVTDSGMKYYGNEQSGIESDIAQGNLATFADRYKLAVEVAKEEPEQVAVIMSGGGLTDYVQETSLHAARQPGAMDYYAIAVTTMIILFGASTAAQLIDTERKGNTATRLLASPITKIEIFAGKIMGNLLQNVIFIAVVVLISKYMFNVYWGENMGLVFLVLFTEIVFALSLGLGFSYVIKGNAAGSVVMVIIQLAAFFGGSYFPLEDITGIMEILTYISPLRWSNDAILQIIYADQWSAAVRAMLLNIGFAVLLLSTALIMMRRREGL